MQVKFDNARNHPQKSRITSFWKVGRGTFMLEILGIVVPIPASLMRQWAYQTTDDSRINVLNPTSITRSSLKPASLSSFPNSTLVRSLPVSSPRRLIPLSQVGQYVV